VEAPTQASPAEAELVRKVLAGDSRAFDRLWAGVERDLAGLLRGALRSAPHVEVDEVLQEVRIYLFRRLEKYDTAYTFLTFAKGLARSVVKRFLYGRRDLVGSLDDEGDDAESTELSALEMKDLPLAFRRAMGEGRFTDPGAEGPSRVFLELLETFLRWGGYPHQQVTFGYSILVWGKDQRKGDAVAVKVPITGDPERVVREVGPQVLAPASGGMMEDLAVSGRLDPEYLARVRQPLDGRLAMTGRELFARDPASAERWRMVAERRVGSAKLQEYFGEDARRSVSDWTHSVKNRIRKVFEDPASTRWLPLPDPPRTLGRRA
jgi:hypothetical protein